MRDSVSTCTHAIHSLERNLLVIPSLPPTLFTPSLLLSLSPKEITTWTDFMSYFTQKMQQSRIHNWMGTKESYIYQFRKANHKHWFHNPKVAGYGPVRNKPKLWRHVGTEISKAGKVTLATIKRFLLCSQFTRLAWFVKTLGLEAHLNTMFL